MNTNTPTHGEQEIGWGHSSFSGWQICHISALPCSLQPLGLPPADTQEQNPRWPGAAGQAIGQRSHVPSNCPQSLTGNVFVNSPNRWPPGPTPEEEVSWAHT